MYFGVPNSLYGDDVGKGGVMYKTLFWIAIISWVVLVGAILKSGGGFVWRVEKLEAGADEISLWQTSLYYEFQDLKFMSEVMRTQVNQLRPR